MNQMVTLNIVDMATMAMTITVSGTIFYDSFADMVLHLNDQNFVV